MRVEEAYAIATAAPAGAATGLDDILSEIKQCAMEKRMDLVTYPRSAAVCDGLRDLGYRVSDVRGGAKLRISWGERTSVKHKDDVAPLSTPTEETVEELNVAPAVLGALSSLAANLKARADTTPETEETENADVPSEMQEMQEGEGLYGEDN